MNQLLLPLLSLTTTVVMSLLLIQKAVAWGFIDLPGERKVHAVPTPRTGGLALTFTAPISLDVAMGLVRRKRLGMSFFTADQAT